MTLKQDIIKNFKKRKSLNTIFLLIFLFLLLLIIRVNFGQYLHLNLGERVGRFLNFGEKIYKLINKNNKVELSSGRVCTDMAEQPDCYSSEFPRPKLIWSCSNSEIAPKSFSYIVQIDNNRFFTSPEIDSGVFTSANAYYEVNNHGLVSGEEYFWRIKIMNKHGDWSGWAVEEDSFITSPLCE